MEICCHMWLTNTALCVPVCPGSQQHLSQNRFQVPLEAIMHHLNIVFFRSNKNLAFNYIYMWLRTASDPGTEKLSFIYPSLHG